MNERTQKCNIVLNKLVLIGDHIVSNAIVSNDREKAQVSYKIDK
jgi:hypothetical protein